MNQTINGALNLVFPLRTIEKPDPKDKDKTIEEPVLWAYHSPLSQAAFQASFRVIARAKEAIFNRGIEYALRTGVTVADLELEQAGKDVVKEFGGENIASALRSELKRLTFILAPGKDGFQNVPVDIALQRDLVTEDEWHDAECVIIFFTCASTMTLRTHRATVVQSAASVMKGSTTSLPPTEFLASLQISTQVATSATAAASSVPS